MPGIVPGAGAAGPGVDETGRVCFFSVIQEIWVGSTSVISVTKEEHGAVAQIGQPGAGERLP